MNADRSAEPSAQATLRGPHASGPQGYAAALWRISPVLPWIAAVVTVLGYVLSADPKTGVPTDPLLSIAAGLAVMIVAGIVAALALRSMCDVAGVQPRFHAELLERRRQLGDRLTALADAQPPAAVTEARTQLAAVDELLSGDDAKPGLGWAMAYGYISVLRALHRAEEALLMVESVDDLVGEALHDELSLRESTVMDRDRLQGLLRAATHSLSPTAGQAFMSPEPGTSQQVVAQLSEKAAREALREVRHAVNAFRDDARDGLIRARNRLTFTVLTVAAVTYLLLGLALVVKVVTVANVGTASALFLVGAIVGLFDRLRVESSRTSAVEDFGLYQTRLAATPLLSGLAAVGGVYLAAMAPALLPAAGSVPEKLPELTKVFDLLENPPAIVYAAIFGLAPGTLTSRLRRQADQLERDLLTSLPATSGGGADTAGS